MFQCTVWGGEERGYHLLTAFLARLPFLIWTLKQDRIVLINNMIYPLKALEWSVWTEKRISSEEVYLFWKIHGAKSFPFFNV